MSEYSGDYYVAFEFVVSGYDGFEYGGVTGYDGSEYDGMEYGDTCDDGIENDGNILQPHPPPFPPPADYGDALFETHRHSSLEGEKVRTTHPPQQADLDLSRCFRPHSTITHRHPDDDEEQWGC